MARTVIATLCGSGPCDRLQVALEQRDGAGGPLIICLCEQHYAEGIGWFTQRSFQLDPRQWQQLQVVLTQHGSGSKKPTEVLFEEEPPVSLPFPGPRSGQPMRSAVGDGAES